MSVLKWVLIILCVCVVVVPMGDYTDDMAFNFSTFKNAIEGISDYQDGFLNDITRLGLCSEALSSALTEGKKVDIEYATRNEWYNFPYSDFNSESGLAVFRLRIFTDATDEEYVLYPTSWEYGVDSWEEYRDYVVKMYQPIKAFVDIYNEYVEADGFFEEIVLILGMIATALFAIIYMLVVFLFDSITMLWGVLLCLLQIIGVAPIRA